jgi:hypothetical protein
MATMRNEMKTTQAKIWIWADIQLSKTRWKLTWRARPAIMIFPACSYDTATASSSKKAEVDAPTRPAPTVWTRTGISANDMDEKSRGLTTQDIGTNEDDDDPSRR